MFSMLGGVVGDDRVNAALKKYVDTWKFKHPSPWDFAFFMNKELGRDLRSDVFDARRSSRRRPGERSPQKICGYVEIQTSVALGFCLLYEQRTRSRSQIGCFRCSAE